MGGVATLSKETLHEKPFKVLASMNDPNQFDSIFQGEVEEEDLFRTVREREPAHPLKLGPTNKEAAQKA